MRILMIAPEPVFEPRGTPLSVVGRLKALSDMGHTVDLLTYPIGKDVELPGIRFLRTRRWFGIKTIKIGPSLNKLPLDILLLFKTVSQLKKNKYHVIHTHEEAGLWGTVLARWFQIPHIYDMHSSLPQQLRNFEFSKSTLLIRLFESMEKWVLKYASAVITICPDLYVHVHRLFPDRSSVLIENVIDYGMVFKEKDDSEKITKRFMLGKKTVALYAGTFESYQGLEMLIQSASFVLKKNSDVKFLMVGGQKDQVQHYQNLVDNAGLTKSFIFTGQVQPQEIRSYLQVADILLSPRISGTNTPLKIYSYLRSGIPIVATRLLTHTQVLSDEVSVLTDPSAAGFAQGILAIIGDPTRCRTITSHARILAESRYSYPVYLDKLNAILSLAEQRGI